MHVSPSLNRGPCTGPHHSVQGPDPASLPVQGPSSSAPRHVQTCSLWSSDCRRAGSWHFTEIPSCFPYKIINILQICSSSTLCCHHFFLSRFDLTEDCYCFVQLCCILSRIVFVLNKRNSRDDTLGSSKILQKANKQLSKTCIVVTCIFLLTLGECLRYLSLIFLETSVVLWGHWYPCLDLLGFKAKVNPSLVCFVTWAQWIPLIHLWCDICWPLGNETQAVLIHTLASKIRLGHLNCLLEQTTSWDSDTLLDDLIDLLFRIWHGLLLPWTHGVCSLCEE